MSDYSLLNIERSGQIATIELIRIEKHLREQQGRGKRGGAQRAAEVGRALNELRDDNTVRVIVITGRDDVSRSRRRATAIMAVPEAIGTSCRA